MTWFYYAIIAGLILLVSDIGSKYLTNRKVNPLIIALIANIYCVFFSALLLFTEPIRINLTIPVIITLVIGCLAYAIGNLTYWRGLAISNISEFSLLYRLSVALVVVSGTVFLKETLSAYQIAGTVAILLGVFCISYQKQKLSLSKGNLMALLTAVLFSVGILVDKIVIPNFSQVLYELIVYVMITGFLLILLPINGVKLTLKADKKTHAMLFVCSFLWTAASFFIYRAYQTGSVSLITLLTQIRLPLVILYGYVVFKEKNQLLPKIIALILMLSGIYLIQF